MMRIDICILHDMCSKMEEVLEELRDIRNAYNLIKEHRTHRILHPDMVRLEHDYYRLREMRRHWGEVLDRRECEELKKLQEASLRDISEIEDEEASGDDE